MASDEYRSKRTRASGEVLNYLLREFNNNHNPTPEQRKEISDRTNMSEKAVRIWFQNRRAKLRKTERAGRSTTTQGGSSAATSRDNSTHAHHDYEYDYDNDYDHSPKHRHLAVFDINEKYCFIDCTSLSVGSWQRVKTGIHDEANLKHDLVNLAPFTLNHVMQKFDLLVIVSKKNLEINYFFSAMSESLKILFRIFYPIALILSCLLLDNNIDKESNELRVTLAHQPKFLVNFYNGATSSSNQWSICEDFSEGQQVLAAHSESGIPHVLVGTKSSISFLNDFILELNQQIQQSYAKGIYSENDMVADFDGDDDVTKEYKYTAQAWNGDTELKANGLSPLGQFGSDTSPLSEASSKPIKSNFHYNEIFSANTPDFVNLSHTPNIILPGTPPQHHIEPVEETPQGVGQYHDLTVPTEQAFDFPVVNEYSGLDHSIHSPVESAIDRFIDYSNYE